MSTLSYKDFSESSNSNIVSRYPHSQAACSLHSQMTSMAVKCATRVASRRSCKAHPLCSLSVSVASDRCLRLTLNSGHVLPGLCLIELIPMLKCKVCEGAWKERCSYSFCMLCIGNILSLSGNNPILPSSAAVADRTRIASQ